METIGKTLVIVGPVSLIVRQKWDTAMSTLYEASVFCLTVQLASISGRLRPYSGPQL